MSRLTQFPCDTTPVVYEHHYSITRIKKLLKGKFVDTNKMPYSVSVYLSFLDKSANNFLYVFHVKLNRETRFTEFHFIDSNCKKHIASLSSSQSFVNGLVKCVIL